MSQTRKFGGLVTKFYVDAEKEEQNRNERLSRERLRAPEADDEEGYLKLTHTTNYARITHLLRHTDS